MAFQHVPQGFRFSTDLIPGVLDELAKFPDVWRLLEKAVGPEWFPSAKTPKITAVLLSQLSSAALPQATVRCYGQGEPIPGVPDPKPCNTKQQKLKKAEA